MSWQILTSISSGLCQLNTSYSRVGIGLSYGSMKMTSPVPAAAGITDDEIQMERNAGLIMGTNNSSIVSKRSVERLYLPEPHFYRYFVRKPQRRSPTINRGYWLRMRAVDWAVREFLRKSPDQPKVVINLGCGYDPLPFQWMAQEHDICQNTKFVDVDYEELMISKREIINNTSKMRDMLTNLSTNNAERSILLDSLEYSAIGCDLRNLPRLSRLLHSVVDLQNCLVLCVAEVSITYMHTEAADALIAWTSTMSSDVTFCLLEQGSPDRPDHPFTTTMMKHFQKLGTPLHSVFDYPGNHAQAERFQRAGFTNVETQNLWELWSDPRFLSPSQRLALDQVEPFDEWEDFALFASHYLLVIAHNRPTPAISEGRRSRRDSIASIASDISARTASPFRPEAQWYAMKHCEDSSEETKRHHGTAYQVPDQDAIATHGGIGPKARLATTAICRSTESQDSLPTVLDVSVGARCCHTITTFANGDNILVGGRASPSQPMKDCWLQTGSTWSRVHDLPEPRYRHRTVPIMLPDNTRGALVFGGKTGPSQVAVDVLLWYPQTGWKVVKSLNQQPIPRFGASFVYLGYNHGVLFGGMRQDGIICQGLWRWRLVIRDNKVAGISFRTSNALDASIGAYPWFARLGASHGLIRDEFLIAGGVAKSGTIPRAFEILSILGSFSAFNEHEKEMRLRLTTVEPVVPPGCPRPFLIGHSTHRTKNGMLVFMGGGATCFSFGNYFNSGAWVLYEREAGLLTDWTVIKPQPSKPASNPQTTEDDKSHNSHLPQPSNVRELDVKTTDHFLEIIRASQPIVLKSQDLGPCLQTWTPTYLRDKINPSRTVITHSSPNPTMNFQQKNFTYQTLPFPTFIDQLLDPKTHLYLRALSPTNQTTTPANFEKDWPELKPDFTLPSQLSPILTSPETFHSSCLRIANRTTMWLHYDVMANMLFQIHGTKKLILFPPSNIKSLSFPPGSTTSELDIFDVDGDVVIPRGTSPQVVNLTPGSALFIPPLWAHAGISLEDATSKACTNIALNFFFRSLPRHKYAAGRDVYGNRDLAAYEDGRKDVERIVRRFGDVKGMETENGVVEAIPREVAKAYLERLSDELKGKAAEL